tara:strand:+ start:8036 stop:9295 length:1260 start_codon:yes stop_codon:yes gene_type:complete
MDVRFDTISTHLDIRNAIKYLKNIKNKENNFNKNFWGVDIETESVFNNYIRTLSYFWLDNDKYTINKVYKLEELTNIPWYYDFRVFEDVLSKKLNVNKNDMNLWYHFNYSTIYKNDTYVDERHYIANKNILKTYIPRGYLIPPFDKNILNIKRLTNKVVDDYEKVIVELKDTDNENRKKYNEINEEIKEYKDNITDVNEFINIQNLRKIAIKNFNLLDDNNDNYITLTNLSNIYGKDMLEEFTNLNSDVDKELKDELLIHNIYLIGNKISKNNYINSVILSYIKSGNYNDTLEYNNSINSLLIQNIKDKIKLLKSEDNSIPENNNEYIDNDNSDKNDKNEIIEMNDHHNNTIKDDWKNILIKIGLWTVGIIIIVGIIIFLAYVFIFNTNNEVNEVNEINEINEISQINDINANTEFTSV